MEQRCDRRVALMVGRAGLPFRQVTGREPDRIPGAVRLSFVRSFYNARAAAPPQISMLERMPPNPHNMGTA
jgi:hypothetical protein